MSARNENGAASFGWLVASRLTVPAKVQFVILSLLGLAFTGTGLGQSPLAPEFYPYAGPTIAYPATQVSFTLIAKDHQPNSLGSNIEYELLVSPANTSFATILGRLDEMFIFITWQTPSRSAVGTTNRFVIKVTDQGTPPLSATNEVGFVITDVPPIRSIAMSNGVPVLQMDNLLPNKPYVVQWAEALPTTNWSPLAFVRSASPSVAIADTNTLAAQRFYRLWSYGWCDGFGCP